MKKMKVFGLGALVLLWAALTFAAWFGPEKDFSDSERRKLARFPDLTGKTVLNGKFMSEFEDYSLDQFPLRDTFRQAKALFHYNVLGQKDNNDIYIVHDYAAKLEYPLNDVSVSNAVKKFNRIYETYLTESENIVFALVPDKGFYLAEENGYPAMDYEALFVALEQGMPWAEFADLTDQLEMNRRAMLSRHPCATVAWLPVSSRVCVAPARAGREVRLLRADAHRGNVHRS